jgi:site-specific recombinase XerD
MTTQTAVKQEQDLGSLIDLYLTSCRVEGKSPETIRSHRESLDIFHQAVHQEELPQDPTSFTSTHVYQFLDHVASTGVSPTTQWRRQRETRTFFSWLTRHEFIPSNPFAKVKNIKVPQKVTQPFSQEDILRLLALCNPSTHKGARDRALILVLLDTGLRAGELTSLQLEDIDFQSQRIHVRHGKGNKQRVVRIGHEAGQVLQHYLDHFRGTELGPVFLTCRRRPLCRTAMRTIFQRLGKQASIPKVHPHRFRHTFATWAIELQAREIDVQFLLGHSTPAMLRRYTATYDAEKAAQAHALFSPADRLNGRLQSQRSGLAGDPSKARFHPGFTPVSPQILNLRP